MAPSAGHCTSTLSGLSWATPPNKGFVAATEDQSLGGISCLAGCDVGAPGFECDPQDKERRSGKVLGMDMTTVNVTGEDIASSISEGKERPPNRGKKRRGGDVSAMDMVGEDAASFEFGAGPPDRGRAMRGMDVLGMGMAGLGPTSPGFKGQWGRS